MNKYLLIIVIFIACQSSFSQEKGFLLNQQLSVDFGSFRNRSLYPITDIKYRAGIFNNISLKFSVRLRSYGTLYFFSKSAYDFTPLAEYTFTNNRNVNLSAGMGLDARIRLVNDDRSEAKSSIEPLISISLHSSYKRFFLQVPLWTRFYSNGISFALLPQLYFQSGEKLLFFLRDESTYLSLFKSSTHEWTNDIFLGTLIMF